MFDLKAALAGASVTTRGGHKVWHVAYCAQASTLIRVVAWIEGRGVRGFTEEGRYDIEEHELDLMMAPPKELKQIDWAGVRVGEPVTVQGQRGFAFYANAEGVELDFKGEFRSWSGEDKAPLPTGVSVDFVGVSGVLCNGDAGAIAWGEVALYRAVGLGAEWKC